MQPNHGVVVDGVAIELPAMPVATAPSAPPPSDAIDAIPIAPVLHHGVAPPVRFRNTRCVVGAVVYFAVILAFIVVGGIRLDGNSARWIGTIAGWLAVLIGIITGVLFLWSLLMMTCPRGAILTSALFTGVILLSLSVTTFAVSPVAGIVTVLLLLVYIVRFCRVRRHVGFVGTVLSLAMRGVADFPGLLVLPVVGSAFIYSWFLAFMTAMAGVVEIGEQLSVNNAEEAVLITFLFLFTLVSLSSVSAVAGSVVYGTAAGIVGTWWASRPEDRDRSSSTLESFGRMMSTSFGSAIYAGFGIPLGWWARTFCCGRCCPAFVNRFHEHGLSIVAMYGKDFRSASEHANRLVEANPWLGTVRSGPVSTVLGAGNVLAATSGVMASLIFLIADDDFLNLFWGDAKESGDAVYIGLLLIFILLIAIIIAIVLAQITVTFLGQVLQGAVNTMFVCFADRPDLLAVNHPETFRILSAAVQAYQAGAESGVVVAAPAAAGADPNHHTATAVATEAERSRLVATPASQEP